MREVFFSYEYNISCICQNEIKANILHSYFKLG
nr:MAG TPA: hypothetical protein [Caudoviricetes sp.]